MTTSEVERATWVPTLTFAAKLALIRHQMGWNIKQAALACGLPPQSWRGWELQRRLPHDIRSIARRIAAHTRVSYEWLIEDESLTETPEPQTIVGLLQPAERVSGKSFRPLDNRPNGRPSSNSTNAVRRTSRLPRGAGQRAA